MIRAQNNQAHEKYYAWFVERERVKEQKNSLCTEQFYSLEYLGEVLLHGKIVCIAFIFLPFLLKPLHVQSRWLWLRSRAEYVKEQWTHIYSMFHSSTKE